MQRQARLILFDLDGTLVNTGGAGLRAFDRALAEEFGPGMNLNVVKPAGMTDPAIFYEIYLHNRGRMPDADESKRLFQSYLRFLREEIATSAGFRVLAGVEPLLERLDAIEELHLGLGTGNLETGAKIKLERANLNRFFPFGGFGSDSDDRDTVLSTAVERGRRRLPGGWEIETVFVVGDTPRDVASGKAIGARTLAVASGPYSRDELLTSGPDLATDDLLDGDSLVKWFLS